jgi:hypothetical protein
MFQQPQDLSNFIKTSEVRIAGFTASANFSGNAANFIKHHQIRKIGIDLGPDQKPSFNIDD